MPFTLTKDHQFFYSKNKYIEFEEVFSSETCTSAKELLDRLVETRLKKMIGSRTPDEIFSAGRDMWRDYPNLSLSRPAAQLAAELFNAKQLRIAFDQYLRTLQPTNSPLKEAYTLQQISCFQPIVGGLLVRLTPDAHPPLMTPRSVGSALFLSPDLLVPWPALFQNPDQAFLLIVYVPLRSRYVLEPQDPHTHALKKLGYGFGDSIQDATHPLLVR
ncbi:MAG: hypothetical protein JSR58_03930 [Verrucomicrobia bacterium]|nr:hypothetical protein [Verrucomicrobiota bacterium]